MLCTFVSHIWHRRNDRKRLKTDMCFSAKLSYKGFKKGLTQSPLLNFRPYYVVVPMRQKSSKPDVD